MNGTYLIGFKPSKRLGSLNRKFFTYHIFRIRITQGQGTQLKD